MINAWVQRGPIESRSSLSTLFYCLAAICRCISLSRDTAEWSKSASKPRANSECCSRCQKALEADELSYAIAATLPMDLMWKQQVLESRSEADRQERLVTYLREWAPHLQKIESQRQQQEGNDSIVN